MSFIKRLPTLIAGVVCLAVAGIGSAVVFSNSKGAYDAYEKDYNEKAAELEASFPHLPGEVILTDEYCQYDGSGEQVSYTDSKYPNSFIYYARDAKIAPLSETNAQEYIEIDDYSGTKLGECISGLQRFGGAITFEIETEKHGMSDIVISLRSCLVDKEGNKEGIENLTDVIKLQVNGLDVKAEDIEIDNGDNFKDVVLKDTLLVTGKNNVTITTSEYNPYHGTNDNALTVPLYIMPEIRNLTVVTDANIIMPEAE